MTTGKRVTISENTVKGLAKIAKPFESPEDCIQRILSCKCVRNEMAKSKKDEVAVAEKPEE